MKFQDILAISPPKAPIRPSKKPFPNEELEKLQIFRQIEESKALFNIESILRMAKAGPRSWSTSKVITTSSAFITATAP